MLWPLAQNFAPKFCCEIWTHVNLACLLLLLRHQGRNEKFVRNEYRLIDSTRQPACVGCGVWSVRSRVAERSALNTVQLFEQNKQTNRTVGEQTKLNNRGGEQTNWVRRSQCWTAKDPFLVPFDHIWSLKCADNDHYISEDQEAATSAQNAW